MPHPGVKPIKLKALYIVQTAVLIHFVIARLHLDKQGNHPSCNIPYTIYTIDIHSPTAATETNSYLLNGALPKCPWTQHWIQDIAVYSSLLV